MTAIDDALHQEALEYAGTVQVFDVDRIAANVTRLGQAIGGSDRVLVAVKSFPSREVLAAVATAGAGFEVSAPSEYELLLPDLAGATVSLNAPRPSDLTRFIDRGNNLHVHVDHPAQLDGLEVPERTRLGLRLSHTALDLDHGGLGDGRLSRFGSTPETWLASAPAFREGRMSGVHLHNGSEENPAAFYHEALERIRSLAERAALPLAFINLGGGFHAIADADLGPLLASLSEAADPAAIFIEPGQVLSRGAGYLLSRVLAIRPIEEGRYNVTLDSSYECHANWSPGLEWTAAPRLGGERRHFRSFPETGDAKIVIHFTGASCYELDVLGVYTLPASSRLPVAVGDVLTFSGLTGYAYAWNRSFNGVPPAATRFVAEPGPALRHQGA